MWRLNDEETEQKFTLSILAYILSFDGKTIFKVLLSFHNNTKLHVLADVVVSMGCVYLYRWISVCHPDLYLRKLNLPLSQDTCDVLTNYI